MSEGMLTVSVGSRLRPEVKSELFETAHAEGVTPSAWIAKLIERELRQRRSEGNDAS
jgi:hypothetical protein